MRSVYSLCAVLLALVSCVPRPDVALRERRTEAPVLFAVSVGSSGYTVLDPIAFIGADSLRAVPPGDSDSASIRFRRDYYRPGRAYPLWTAGASSGEIAVVEAEEHPCYGLRAEAQLTPSASRPFGNWSALAGVLPRSPRTPVRRPPTLAEKAIIDSLARLEFEKRGHPGSMIEGARPVTTAAVRRNGRAGEILVGTYFVGDRRQGRDQNLALVMIAEPVRSTYQPVWVWWHDAGEVDVVRSEFLDALDINGKGDPELVLRSTYYESWDYAVLTRQAGGWVESFRGGGAGC